MAGGEVVEADHRLVELEQRLHQVRADEAGAAGHEPAQRLRRQSLAHVVDRASSRRRPQSRQTVTPLPVSSPASNWLFTSATTAFGSSRPR